MAHTHTKKPQNESIAKMTKNGYSCELNRKQKQPDEKWMFHMNFCLMNGLLLLRICFVSLSLSLCSLIHHKISYIDFPRNLHDALNVVIYDKLRDYLSCWSEYMYIPFMHFVTFIFMRRRPTVSRYYSTDCSSSHVQHFRTDDIVYK